MIGNLYFKGKGSQIPIVNEPDFELGPMVHTDFFVYN